MTAAIAYLLTPWSRALLEKLTGTQLVKKFPAFYENQRLINTFMRACHLSLSCPAFDYIWQYYSANDTDF